MTITLDESDTITDSFTDEDLTFFFKEDEAKVCEGGSDSEPCDNEAQYAILTKCCAKKFLICEECLFEAHRRGKDMRSKCLNCGNKFARGEFPFIVDRL